MNPPTAAAGLLALASMAMTLGGCSLADAPTLTVVDAAIVEQGPSESLVMVTVEAENPNDEPLPLRLARYEVTVDGGAKSFTERSAEAALPPKGKSSLRLFSVIPSASATVGQSYRTSGDVGYIAPGRFAEALYDLGILRSSASFSGAGVLGLGQLPAGRLNPIPTKLPEQSAGSDEVR
jgi:hypothetical protein